MIIETERLFLREMTARDFDALYKVLADSDTMKYYPCSFGKKEVENWINKNQERYRVFGFGLWAVCLKSTHEMIGDCGLTMQLINGQIKPEIGYHIRKDMQRRGYAKEAAAAVRDWTFNNTPFQMIYSYMPKANGPSIKTAIAYGCHEVEEFSDETGVITKVLAISRTQWQEKSKKEQQKSVSESLSVRFQKYSVQKMRVGRPFFRTSKPQFSLSFMFSFSTL